MFQYNILDCMKRHERKPRLRQLRLLGVNHLQKMFPTPVTCQGWTKVEAIMCWPCMPRFSTCLWQRNGKNYTFEWNQVDQKPQNRNLDLWNDRGLWRSLGSSQNSTNNRTISNNSSRLSPPNHHCSCLGCQGNWWTATYYIVWKGMKENQECTNGDCW